MNAKGMTAHPTGGEARRQPLVAALLSAVVPGVGQWYARRRRRGLVLLAISTLLIVGGVGWVALDPVAVAKLAFEPALLRGLLVIDALLLIYRAWASWDAYRCAGPADSGPGRAVATLAGVVVGSLLLVPHAWFAYYDLIQLDLITSVFASPTTTTTAVTPPPSTLTTLPPVDTNSPVASTGTTSTTTSSTTTTTTPPPVIWEDLERLNILLLGSDAGLGRTGVRTDTMILVSLDPVTGDAALLSVPRNFAQVPLPASVDIWDCDCFPDIINALYRYGEEHPDSFPGSITPGATAIKGAIGELLGVPVHYYALVSLDGFVDMVDALGGVTITVSERVYDEAYPKEGGGTEVIDFQPGVYTFDGHDALAYARSRRASDDYDRMGRQRCVLEALAAQADPLSLLRGFPALADAIKRSVETDIPLDTVPALIELTTLVDTDRVISIPFVPPTYVSGRDAAGYNIPNVELIRRHTRIATTLPPAEAIELLGIEPLADACGR
jgi:LCP family protein required for cell wall assembly